MWLQLQTIADPLYEFHMDIKLCCIHKSSYRSVGLCFNSLTLVTYISAPGLSSVVRDDPAGRDPSPDCSTSRVQDVRSANRHLTSYLFSKASSTELYYIKRTVNFRTFVPKSKREPPSTAAPAWHDKSLGEKATDFLPSSEWRYIISYSYLPRHEISEVCVCNIYVYSIVCTCPNCVPKWKQYSSSISHMFAVVLKSILTARTCRFYSCPVFSLHLWMWP